MYPAAPQYGAADGQQYEAYEQGYGAVNSGYPSKSPFMRGTRRQFNIPSMCVSLFAPILLFVFLSSVCTFKLHFEGGLPYSLCRYGCVGIVLFFGYLAYVALRRKSAGEGEPTWYIFLFVTSIIALVAASTHGNANYAKNMKPYYSIQVLNVYEGIDPQVTRGQEMMDAGRVTFVESARLDLSKSMGFRDKDIYCVAPIVSGNASMNRWDFWAVGINCCSGHTTDFACGEFNNPMAHSGLRLFSEAQRPFFRLAIQQAQAAYNIDPVVFPVTFFFMQDPLAEINYYQDEGVKTWTQGLFTFAALQLCLVAVATVMFSRMSHM